MKIKVKIKKLHHDVMMPNYAYKGDAGLDLYSLNDYQLKPQEIKTFFLGFALEFPKNYVALVKDKGGLANKNFLHTLGGVFDSTYRGEYNVCLVNLGNKTYQIKKGQKIAQIIILPFAQTELQSVSKLKNSQRGLGKFGSTGR